MSKISKWSNNRIYVPALISINLCGSDTLLIGGVYRSPSSHLSTSVDSPCSLLTGLNNDTCLLICDNFNFGEISWSDLSGSTSNSHIEAFVDVVDDLFLFQHVCKPTRFRLNESPSLLYFIFTNESDMINNLLYLPPLGNSDHICMEFNLMCYTEQKKSDDVKYNIRAANYDILWWERLLIMWTGYLSWAL